MNIADAIKSGFADTPYPGSRLIDISATKHDEGIYEYFVGSDQFDHDVKDLRYHSCALSFFTDAAFRYWLPAFMIAELEDPVEADVIGESIAFHLSDAQGAPARICVFTDREIDAVKRFLSACVSNSDEIGAAVYRKALEKISKTLRGRSKRRESNG